eukprot:TRINITY_DN76383_c0_g1_i1.p1 TRINITY_DN76383_c0_g1~~TRINITY_DN76383_c0_g1_i1.p1  ORF type:complete len:721 (+),score=84.32 TRINITY_DN76383_c0_g1_i1:290-2452(+)
MWRHVQTHLRRRATCFRFTTAVSVVAATTVALLNFCDASMGPNESSANGGIWAFLNCDGHAAWAGYRERLREVRRNHAIYKVSPVSALLNTMETLAAESDAMISEEGSAVNALQFAMALSDPRAPRDPADCVYGLSTALFVRGLYWLVIGDASSARQDWDIALRSLGRDLGLDFLESTAWGIRSAEFLLAYPQGGDIAAAGAALAAGFFASTGGLRSLLPVTAATPSAVVKHAEAHRSRIRAVDPHCARWACDAPMPTPWRATRITTATLNTDMPRQISVMIYGYHPVLVEPIATLALGSSRVPNQLAIKLLWYGVSLRDCLFFAPLCSDETRRFARLPVPGGLRFRTYTSQSDVDEVAQSYHALWVAEFATGLKPDLLLCMELRDAYFLWRVGRVPTIYYPAIIFLQDEAFTDFGAAVYLQQFDAIRRHDILAPRGVRMRTSKTLVPTAVVAQSPYLAENVFYHTSRRVPSVRPLALYVGPRYTPNSTSADGVGLGALHTLVLCARTRLLMSHSCRLLFRQGRQLLPRRTRLRIHLPSGDSDVVHGLPFDAVARFDSTVLFPWNIAITTFAEMYAMQMPLFVPDAPWLARLWPKAMTAYQRSHSTLHRKLRHRNKTDLVLDASEAEHPTPYPSLDRIGPDFGIMLYWAAHYSHLYLPGVKAFSSIPDLLRLLHSGKAELEAMSEAMRSEADAAKREVVPFWENVVASLTAVAAEAAIAS